MWPPDSIALVLMSKRVTSPEHQLIADAIEEQLQGQFSDQWLSGRPPPVVAATGVPTDPSVWPVFISDAPGAPGELGVHYEARDTPTGQVFVAPILDSGGTVKDGPNSVSVTTSHEVLEMLADCYANFWADDAAGTSWALEVCDAVEAHSYVASNGAHVSDFVTRAWFDSEADTAKTNFDRLGRLTRPFQIDPGGYAIVRPVAPEREQWGLRTDAERLNQDTYAAFGTRYPLARRAQKLSRILGGSRLSRRAMLVRGG